MTIKLFKKVKKENVFKALALILTALLTFMFISPFGGKAYAAELSTEKSASWKDLENHIANVIFTFPSQQYQAGSAKADIVIVYDKSSSGNEAFKEAVNNMVNSFSGIEGMEISVGIIWFNVTAHEGTDGILPLYGDPAQITANRAGIDAAINAGTGSGTNIHAALQLASEWLAESDKPPENQHIVIVSDYGGYLYSDAEGHTVTKAVDIDGVASHNANLDVSYKYGGKDLEYEAKLRDKPLEVMNDFIVNKTLLNGELAPEGYLDTTGAHNNEYRVDSSIKVIDRAEIDASLLPKVTDLYAIPDYVTGFEKSAYLVARELLKMKEKKQNVFSVSSFYKYNDPKTMRAFNEAFQMWIGENIGPVFDVNPAAGETPEELRERYESYFKEIEEAEGRGNL